jgi:hypothetical protein
MAVTAAWEEVDAGRVVGSRVYVAQTSNAWQTTAVAALPMSACSGTSQQTLHPMTARSVHDNSVYVAALESVTGSQRAYTISRRPTGGALETVGHPFQCASYPNGAIDGALFVGPRAPDPMNLGDAVHIIHNLFRSPSCGSSGGPGWSAMAGNRSEDAAGQIWLQPFPGYRVQLPGQDDCQLAGAEISAIVIQDSLFRGGSSQQNFKQMA